MAGQNRKEVAQFYFSVMIIQFDYNADIRSQGNVVESPSPWFTQLYNNYLTLDSD